MSAGQPDWVKLHQMKKLPKGAEKFIPGLVHVEETENKLEKAKQVINALKTILVKHEINFKDELAELLKPKTENKGE